MKSLYKGKGKIHPSPSCHGVPPGGGGADALAVLSLLPAAILALTTALKSEDREVLAYLVTRSLQGPVSVAAEEKRRCWRLGSHQPLFGCGCFDCYTSYWFRWDSSPDRELINQAIEAFDEHLASSEKLQPVGKGGRRRDRKERSKAEVAEVKGKGKKKFEKDKKKAMTSSVDEAGRGEEGTSLVVTSSFHRKEEAEKIYHAEVVPEADVRGREDDGSDEEEGEAAVAGMEMVAMAHQQGGGSGERRGWPDVMGLFNSRFWNLWSPGV